MNGSRASSPRAYDQNGQLVFTRVFLASGFFLRLRGLLGRASPDLREAWWFQRCSTVHTFGMAFAIDVVHLSDDSEILRISEGVVPWRIAACRGAHQVIELRNGAAAALALRAGQRLTLRQ